MIPDDSIKRRAKKVVDAGSVPLAHFMEAIDTNDKLEALLNKPDMEMPEIPEFPSTIAITLPEGMTLKGEKGDTPTKEELIELITPLIPEPVKGDTPIKGKDYFTKKEIEEFISKATPVKGVDYFDGIDADEPIYVGMTAPSNPVKGNLWYKI